MITLSMEQAVTVLCVCFFVLGFIIDRVYLWFYEQYISAYEEDKFIEE